MGGGTKFHQAQSMSRRKQYEKGVIDPYTLKQRAELDDVTMRPKEELVVQERSQPSEPSLVPAAGAAIPEVVAWPRVNIPVSLSESSDEQVEQDEVEPEASSEGVKVIDLNAGAKAWQQRRNHRTQLQIATNDITSSGTAGAVAGPLPYVYVAYSTVNPEHASPIDGTNYEMVCPLPTHPAYAELTSALITGTDIAAAGGEVLDLSALEPHLDRQRMATIMDAGYVHTWNCRKYTDTNSVICQDIENTGLVCAVLIDRGRIQ